MSLQRLVTPLISLSFLVVFAACGGSDEPAPGDSKFEVVFHQATSSLHVMVHPGLPAGHTLHARVRQGQVGFLDCATMAAGMARIDKVKLGTGTNGGHAFQGPLVDWQAFQTPYDESWLDGAPPTTAMIQGAAGTIHTIDLCLMNGSTVTRGAEMDILRALDVSGTGKFDDHGTGAENIGSVVAYAQACVYELGEIPFFEPLGEHDYATYSCLDSVPIDTTVTNEEGMVTWPQEQVSVCDRPQFIYSLCERNAVKGETNGPRVASRTNEQGTTWVLLCRKSKEEEGQYNDVAMLGHNPYTGKTCFFQNGLYVKTDGDHVPHPGDDLDSPASPQQSATLWSGIHGGLGSGIECASCHDSDPFIHTPWIDQAKDARGDTVIPKMGVHDGYALGFKDAPYSLVDAEGQGWTMPKVLVSEEAAACTKCHRISNGRWARQWIERLVAKDTPWNNIVTPEFLQFEHMYWMPPDMEGIDETTWAESEYGKATEFVLMCADSPTNEACKWSELPVEQLADLGELPDIDLEGIPLATEALKVLGADVSDPADPRCTGEGGSCATRRCSECHSVSKSGLKHWASLTATAQYSCSLDINPDEMSQDEALTAVNCLRSRPEEPDSVFAADKIGVLTTGARYSYFRRLFQKAYGDQEWLSYYIRFKARVSMPKGTYAALSQHEHAVVLKWFASNLSHLEELIHDPPPPTSCDPFFDTLALETHIENMKYDGWDAANKEAGLWMFACPVGADASDCFQAATYFDRTAEWGNGNGSLREVTKLAFRTSFWTRSSADGRFVANGGGTAGGATITDMVRGIDIKVKASYDPGFFPDNSGFIFQGGGTGICAQSILETALEVDFTDPSCIKATNINLYQHVARGLNGGDYFVINSQFTSDSGNSAMADPKAHFNAGSTMKFSPMIFNGQTYEQLGSVIVDSPYEGDSVLSPSGRMVISRLAGGANSGPLGYVLRRVDTEKFGDSYIIKVEAMLARICSLGAKANISYDERFYVTHHYADGKSNIFLYDFLTNEELQITNMPEGHKALFPHFRSDGWFYFLVRTGDSEYVVASDLAVIRAAKVE